MLELDGDQRTESVLKLLGVRFLTGIERDMKRGVLGVKIPPEARQNSRTVP